MLAHQARAQSCAVWAGGNEGDISASCENISANAFVTCYAAGVARRYNYPYANGGPTNCPHDIASLGAGCEYTITYATTGFWVNGIAASASLCPVQASTKDAGKSCTPNASCGDPIVMSIGNKVRELVDYQSSGINALR